MKIVNINNSPLKACCVFPYGGFEVSASTIFKPSSVLVYGKNNKVKYTATSIPNAINWINTTEEQP